MRPILCGGHVVRSPSMGVACNALCGLGRRQESRKLIKPAIFVHALLTDPEIRSCSMRLLKGDSLCWCSVLEVTTCGLGGLKDIYPSFVATLWEF
jgi:hypothetical protein